MGFWDFFGHDAAAGTSACHGCGDIILRQHRVKDTIKANCTSANRSPVCVQKRLLPKTIQDQMGIFDHFFAGQLAALDFTPMSPMHSSLITDAAVSISTIVGRFSKLCGYASAHLKIDKMSIIMINF